MSETRSNPKLITTAASGLNGRGRFYRGRVDGQSNPSDPLPAPIRPALDIPSAYEPDEGLIAAVNVALMLRMPLLLTGKPGTGKTELARSLTMSLHGATDQRLFDVIVSSTADKSDLLYRYDELGRLRDAYGNTGRDKTPRDYLSLRGLGAAIVAAGRPADPLHSMVPGRELPKDLRTLVDLIDSPPVDGAPDPRLAAFLPDGARPPVVLIDEIDKAPRELPNDLLTELDRMRFDIPELGARVELAKERQARWPVVVITSNAERPLSDAFLRRCVCFEVEVPQEEKLASIVNTKLKALGMLDGRRGVPADVASFVKALSESREIPENEQPGIARILDFTVLITDPRRFGYAPLREMPEELLRTALTALMPSRSAQERAWKVWDQWRKPSTR